MSTNDDQVEVRFPSADGQDVVVKMPNTTGSQPSEPSASSHEVRELRQDVEKLRGESSESLFARAERKSDREAAVLAKQLEQAQEENKRLIIDRVCADEDFQSRWNISADTVSELLGARLEYTRDRAGRARLYALSSDGSALLAGADEQAVEALLEDRADVDHFRRTTTPGFRETPQREQPSRIPEQKLSSEEERLRKYIEDPTITADKTMAKIKLAQAVATRRAKEAEDVARSQPRITQADIKRLEDRYEAARAVGAHLQMIAAQRQIATLKQEFADQRGR